MAKHRIKDKVVPVANQVQLRLSISCKAFEKSKTFAAHEVNKQEAFLNLGMKQFIENQKKYKANTAGAQDWGRLRYAQEKL